MTKSAYIHIPFCNSICSYCNFVKTINVPDMIDKYLEALDQEIKDLYNQEQLNTLYIGGGSPDCLSVKQLQRLFLITNKLNLSKDIEFTIECNIENITEEKLILFKENKVNRLSIGVQTLNNKFLKYLNRNHTKDIAISNINLAKQYFDNISIDLIYAINNQTIEDLEADLKAFLLLDINHISMYSLIIEPGTKLYHEQTKPIDEDLDANMHDLIIKTLTLNGFNHYEISNFGKTNYVSKHNLAYWNNEEYYGFGVGASGYVNNVRYKNTNGFTAYMNKNYKKSEEFQTKELKMSYEMILGLRKTKGVNINKFNEKYQVDIFDIFDIKTLLEKKWLQLDNNQLFVPLKYEYVLNEILIYFI